jgi:hypothetical protein
MAASQHVMAPMINKQQPVLGWAVLGWAVLGMQRYLEFLSFYNVVLECVHNTRLY